MEVSGFPQVTVAGIIFLVVIACFTVLSVILNHHWSHYELEKNRRRKARRVYYSGAGAILVMMLVAFIFLLI